MCEGGGGDAFIVVIDDMTAGKTDSAFLKWTEASLLLRSNRMPQNCQKLDGSFFLTAGRWPETYC